MPSFSRISADRGGNVRVFAVDEARRHLHDRDLAAEPPVHLGEFQPDIAAADDHQMARHEVDRHHRAVRQIGRPDRARARFGTTARPPTLMKIRSAVEDGVADLNLVRRDKAGMALIDRAIRQGPQALFDPHARLLRKSRSFRAFTRGMSTRTAPSRPTPNSAGSARHMGRVGAGDQCLCRNAAGIDAGAAERAAFDDRDGHARSRQPPRQRRSGLPGADDDGIVGWLPECSLLPCMPPKHFGHRTAEILA